MYLYLWYLSLDLYNFPYIEPCAILLDLLLVNVSIANSYCSLLLWEIIWVFCIKIAFGNLVIIAYEFQEFLWFLWDFLHRQMSSVNNDSFISFFLICILFFSFLCFIALAKNSSKMLRSNEKGHTCFVPSFRGKGSNF